MAHVAQITARPRIQTNTKTRTPKVVPYVLGTNEPVSQQEQQQALTKQQRIDIAGKLAWTMLHSYKGCERHWLMLWNRFIPEYCECSAGYREILALNPPNFKSPKDFFVWGCNVHNLVSAKLKKPIWTEDQFFEHWVPRRASFFGIHCPLIYGGLERWALSFSWRSFGIAPVNSLNDTAPDILQNLNDQGITLTTIPEIAYSNKVILVSNSPDFQKPPGAIAVLVAHGYCEYTRNWVEKCHSQCDYIVGVSEEVCSALESWTGREAFIIENGADLSRLSTPTKGSAQFLKLHNIPEKSTVLSYIGRLTEEKGVSKLFEVLYHLPKDHYLFVMGWGDVNHYMNVAERYNLLDRVRFLPPSHDQANLLNATDLFISLPESEGFGLSVMEAMLLGKRVVHTSTGIVKQLKRSFNDYGPFVVETTDQAADIAKGIHRAYPVHPNLLTNFTHDAFVRRWERFITEITS